VGADFRNLWAGQTVSLFGSEVTQLALPLVAVLALGAGAAEMGFLRAIQFAPELLALVIGAFVDRTRRRPLLIGADLGRAVVLGILLVPVTLLLSPLRGLRTLPAPQSV